MWELWAEEKVRSPFAELVSSFLDDRTQILCGAAEYDAPVMISRTSIRTTGAFAKLLPKNTG